MRSPTSALLWEIWRRERGMFFAVIALTIAGRAITVFPSAHRTIAAGNASTLVEVLWMASFLILFGIFNYTESTGSRRLGRFPRRLFTLPVSTLRLVATPMLAGIVAVEALYLLWLDPRSIDVTSVMFGAVIVGALMVFYQSILWTLDRLGPLRLVVIGLVVVLMFAVNLLPSAPPNPPPMWRSEGVLAALTLAAAVLVFLGVWSHLARLRSGGGRRVLRIESVVDVVTAWLPQRRRPFASPAAAHFWYEWRCSGLVLPMLTAGVLFAVIGPLSWLDRHDASDTLNLLIGALAAPILLAMAVGIGFAKPTFWSEDLSIPPFVAARPLTDEDIVATKVTVAMASAAVTWLLVLAFVSVWLTFWGNLDSLRRVVNQLWTMYGRSTAAMCGLAVLIVIAGMFLTWRFLVSRLWSGLSGRRPLFIGSAVSLGLLAIGCLVFDVRHLVGWLFEDPGRTTLVVWAAAIAVTAKYGLTAYSWRPIARTYIRQYAVVWSLGTTCFAALGILLWRIVRMATPIEIDRLQILIVLLALLAVPVARLGAARSSLARNRHR